MGRKPASLILAVAAALLLAGCLDDKPDKVVVNVAPTDYKDEIIASLKKGVFLKNDTIRVSNAFLSDPVLQPVGKQQLYVACVRYTAHGAHNEIGDAVRVGYFYGGHLNQIIPAQQGECDKAVYKPFAELNAFCTGIGCKKQ